MANAYDQFRAIVQEWLDAYPESMFPVPPKAATLTREQQVDRSNESAAMGRHMAKRLLDQIAELEREAMANAPGELVRLLDHSLYIRNRHSISCPVLELSASFRDCDCWLSRALELARSQAELLRLAREALEAARGTLYDIGFATSMKVAMTQENWGRTCATAVDAVYEADKVLATLSEAPAEQPDYSETDDIAKSLRAEDTSKGDWCSDCPPVGYPTDETRCDDCPRQRLPAGQPGSAMAPTQPADDQVSRLKALLSYTRSSARSQGSWYPEDDKMVDDAMAEPAAPVLPDALGALEEWLARDQQHIAEISRSRTNTDKWCVRLWHINGNFSADGSSICAAILAALEASK